MGKIKGVYHVRVELSLPGGDHHPMYSFYNVRAIDKLEAGIKARKAFCEEFKSTFKNTEVGYVWDEGTNIEERLPIID
jgi:hypothetical protein